MEGEKHYKDGFTFSVFFPPEAPKELVDLMVDKLSELVYGDLLESREGWDPFAVGHGRDVLRILHDCECCPPHVYFSTSCFHGNHGYCQGETGLLGNKTPSVCKFCSAPCVCGCHAPEKSSTVDG